MKTILHIGQSKTGTSAIQSFLSNNREALSRQGILYPDVSIKGIRVGLVNHNSLSDSLTGRVVYPHLSAEQYHRQINQAVTEANAQMLILSGEHFFGGEPRIWNLPVGSDYYASYKRKLSTLKTFVGDDEVKIFIYLRNQLDWFRSSMTHLIRFQLVHEPTDIYRSDRQYFELVKPLLGYGQMLDCWAEAFGASSILAVPYDRATLFGGNVILDFANRIGIQTVGLTTEVNDEKSNLSLSGEYIELKKRLNLEVKSKHKERATIACLDKLSARASSGLRYCLDPGVEEDIYALAACENAYVNKKFSASGTELRLPERRPHKVVPQIEVARAAAEFREEFSKPEYKIQIVTLWAKYLLRNHFTLLHTGLRAGLTMAKRFLGVIV